MKILRILVPAFLVIACLLSGFTTVAQQNPVKISTMQINIWPEYDRPETLVIYRINLSADTKLPVQISLRIPRAAGSPYNVAMKDLDGLLYDLEYSLISEGDWNRVVFITSSAELQVEYYDPIMQRENARHSFRFRWIGDYPIEDLKIIVQKPRTATNLSLDSSFGSGVVNPDDQLTYYTADLGKLDTGIAYTLQFSYEKSDDDLSARTVSVSPAGVFPIHHTFFERLSSIFSLVMQNRGLLITGVLILVCLALFFFVSLVAGGKINQLGDLYPRSKKRAVKEASTEEETTYCYKCGKPARPGDIYCRVCGSKLKIN